MKEKQTFLDKLITWIFLLGIASLFIWGTFELSTNITPSEKKSATEKKMPDSLHFTCVHCGWDNTRSLFDFIDTTQIDSAKSDSLKIFYNGMH